MVETKCYCDVCGEEIVPFSSYTNEVWFMAEYMNGKARFAIQLCNKHLADRYELAHDLKGALLAGLKERKEQS